MGRKSETEVEREVLEFVTRYVLLGIMAALPSTPSFMDYEAVYLPNGRFLKKASMETDEYLSLFYPFVQLDLVKNGIVNWDKTADAAAARREFLYASAFFCGQADFASQNPAFVVTSLS